MPDRPPLLVLPGRAAVARLRGELLANRVAAGWAPGDLAVVTLAADGDLGVPRAELAAAREVLVVACGAEVTVALAELLSTGGELPGFHGPVLLAADRAATAGLPPGPGWASDHVVMVLGHREPGSGPEHRISAHSRARLFRAEELGLDRPLRAAILTGYTRSGGLSEAEQLGREWTLPDVPAVLEVAGRNTAENAARSLPLILALGGVRRVSVVTSPWHLRAPYFFASYRRFGLDADIVASRAVRGWGHLLVRELHEAPAMRRERREAMALLTQPAPEPRPSVPA